MNTQSRTHHISHTAEGLTAEFHLPGWINYNHLYYFHVVAQTESLSKASALLHIGQAALSVQIRKLESQLGIDLFERKQKRLFLNAYGRVALAYTKVIFRLGAEMTDALHDRNVEELIKIQVGKSPRLSSSILSGVLKKISTLKENYNTQWSTLEDEAAIELLVTHQIDIFFTDRELNFSSDLPVQIRLWSSQDIVCLIPKSQTSKTIALNKMHSVWSQLQAWLNESASQQAFKKLFFENPSVVCEVDSLEQSLKLAIDLNAIGFALREDLSDLTKLKKQFQIFPVNSIKFQTRLYALEKKVSHPALERLLRVMENDL